MRKTLLLSSAVAMALSLSVTVMPGVAGAQMVDGPKVSWKLSLWGKRRAFTEGMEHVSSEVSKRTGGKPHPRLR